MIVARLFQRFEGGFVVHLKTKHEAYFFVSLLFFSLSLVCTLESVLVQQQGAVVSNCLINTHPHRRKMQGWGGRDVSQTFCNNKRTTSWYSQGGVFFPCWWQIRKYEQNIYIYICINRLFCQKKFNYNYLLYMIAPEQFPDPSANVIFEHHPLLRSFLGDSEIRSWTGGARHSAAVVARNGWGSGGFLKRFTCFYSKGYGVLMFYLLNCQVVILVQKFCIFPIQRSP